MSETNRIKVVIAFFIMMGFIIASIGLAETFAKRERNDCIKTAINTGKYTANEIEGLCK